MIFVLLFFLVFAVWIFVELLMAPRGYEDKDGFHYGIPQKKPGAEYRRSANFH